MFCDCGCLECWAQVGPHAPCSFECVECAPRQHETRTVIGGKPGREIIHIESE